MYSTQELDAIHKELAQAKHLIQLKKYRQARRVLEAVSHPKAHEWLAKLDEIDAKKSRRTRTYVVVSVAAVMLLFGGLCALTGNLGSSVALPTIAAIPSVKAAMFRPTPAKTDKPDIASVLPPTITKQANEPTVITNTATATIKPSVTPSKIPTASAKAEADRVKLLKRKFRGIAHLTGTGEVRAYPSANKQDFIVSIEAFLDIFGEAEPIANALKTRTIQALGFTPNKFTVLIFNGYWIEKYVSNGTRWTVDRLYDDNRINVLVTTATYLAPTATRYVPPTDIPIIEYYPTYTIPTLDYSYIYPTSVPSGGSSNGATALCNDGTYSYSANHRGTCSHHGGVAQWYN